MKHDVDVKRFVIIPAIVTKTKSTARGWNKDLSWLSSTLSVPDDDLDVTLWQKNFLDKTDPNAISSASAQLMKHLELDSAQKVVQECLLFEAGAYQKTTERSHHPDMSFSGGRSCEEGTRHNLLV
jgi:hypothetical protein